MDVSLSPNSQTLTLISFLSHSSSSSTSSTRRFSSLPREFLASTNRLRPPGLHSHKKCKKSCFRIQSPRFIVRAFADPIVVFVAVATVSALTVVYLNYARQRRRRKNNTKEHLGPDSENVKGISASKDVKALLNKDAENQALDLGNIVVDTHMVGLDFGSERINASVKPGVQHESASMYRENLIVEASGSLGSDVLTFKSNVSVTTKELEGVSETEGPAGAESVSREHGLVIEPVSNGSVIPVTSENGKTKDNHDSNHAVNEAINLHVPDYSGLLKESSREELHKFYEENQHRTISISNFRDIEPTSTHCVPPSNSSSSLLRTNILHEPEALVQSTHHISVSLKGEMHLAPCKDDSSSKREDYRRGTDDPKSTGNGIAGQNNRTSWLESPQQNGRHANSKHDLPNYLSTYNRMLRNGRLADCIELLETVEQEGLLDMDKIYHMKFFSNCKSQKAVKEAFRFAKLIHNPTLSTFNALLSVCASSQDSEGAFGVLHLVKEAGLRADCKLYTTLISTCAKSGKVDAMFKVFHEMVNAGVEPNLHTYGALIDGSARDGQVAKAFGAYGILRSKNVKPDRIIFNALINACCQSGAVDRAFDVLAEMKAEPTPIDPDHVTIGALIKTCTKAGQFDRAHEAYKMIHQYKIKGTPEVYTIAVSSCSQMGDLEFALTVYRDMQRNGVIPDEMFLSALIDVAGHAGEVDVAFKVVEEARTRGIKLGNVTYSSLMGACSNSKQWQKALELYEEIKSIKLRPTSSMLNALVTALCDGEQLEKAVEVLAEMKKAGVSPNIITYSVLIVGSEKKDSLDIGYMLYSQAKEEVTFPNLTICKCLIGMCLRRFQKARSLGDGIFSFKSGKPQVDNEWTSLALTVYRETITSGITPTMEVLSLILGCLQLPHDTSSKVKLVENLEVSTEDSRFFKLKSLLDGFGEYDPRAFSLLEEATSYGIVPRVSFKKSTITVDARKMQIHTVEVYILTILKGLKHRLAAGAKLPNINIILPVEEAQVQTPKGEKTIKLAGRAGQEVGALLRRLGLRYQGNVSNGKIRINGISMKRWFQPKHASSFGGRTMGLNPSEMRLGKGITDQQRDIRMSNLSSE